MPISLPSEHNGRGLWLDSDVKEIVDKLHYGDPVAGWEGDERLGLYRTSDGRWELMRLEENGSMSTVARSSNDANLHSLIPHLVAHDMHRDRNPFDLVKFTDAQGDLPTGTPDEEQVAERLERVYHALNKDIG